MKWALLLLLVGCSGTSEETATEECVDDGDCDGLARCNPNGTCRQVECIDSSQCALGNHCNEGSNTCFTGCLEDTDCLAGELCDTETTECIPADCTQSEVDCYIGQLCYQDSGECLLPAGLCLDCYDIDERAECTDVYNGKCRSTPGGGYHCLLECDPTEEETPRGFFCLELTINNATDYRWYGDCSVALSAPQE